MLDYPLGSPWLVHPCWEENQDDHDKVIREAIDKYESLRKPDFDKIDFSKKYDFEPDWMEGLIIGYNRRRRIIVSEKGHSDTRLQYREVVFHDMERRHYKLFVPEDIVRKVVMFSHVMIKIVKHERNGKQLLELKEVRDVDWDSSGKVVLKIDSELRNYLKEKWTFQFGLYEL